MDELERYCDSLKAAWLEVAAMTEQRCGAPAFDATKYGQVYDAICQDVMASGAFLTYAAEFAGPDGYDEAAEEALHALTWAIIERSEEVPDAVAMAFEIMAAEEARNHPEED